MKKEKLVYEVYTILSYMANNNIDSIPKANINNFSHLLDYNFNNIKLIVLDSAPFKRPDSSGLSCFKDSRTNLSFIDSFYHERVKQLFGKDFNDSQIEHYQNEGILFLNLSLTTSYSDTDHLYFWQDTTDKILKYFLSQNQPPIILSLGGKTTLNKILSIVPNNNIVDIIGEFERGLVLEHIPLDKLYLINLGDIQDLHKKDFSKRVSKYNIKDIINNLLTHKNLKKINWYEISK